MSTELLKYSVHVYLLYSMPNNLAARHAFSAAEQFSSESVTFRLTHKQGTNVLSVSVQVYKRAKALDQSDNDISAVYRAYIH